MKTQYEEKVCQLMVKIKETEAERDKVLTTIGELWLLLDLNSACVTYRQTYAYWNFWNGEHEIVNYYRNSALRLHCMYSFFPMVYQNDH